MKRRYKIATLITCMMLVIVAVSTMGVSYAIWTSADGIIDGGNTSQSPSVTPDLENYVWAKYFNYNVLSTAEDSKTGTIELTTFYHEATGSGSYGINLSDVYFPSEIWVKVYSDKSEERINTKEEKKNLEEQLQRGNTEEGNGENTKTISTIRTYMVTSISNQVFMDTTLKELAVNIYIPSTVTNIEDMAFANLPNLEYVYCLNSNKLTIGNYAFIGCENLKVVYKVSTGDVVANENAFLGTTVEGVTSSQSQSGEKE